jgi:hypothetical protein
MFIESRLYPDRQTYSRNKARKLSSQVVMAASFELLLSTLHKYNERCPVSSGKNVTYFTSEKHSGIKQTQKLVLLYTGTHSGEDKITIEFNYVRKIRQ